MKRNISIQLKAVFLLIVFCMNTITGFACGVGFDMGFNKKHHHDDLKAKQTVHIHEDGKKLSYHEG